MEEVPGDRQWQLGHRDGTQDTSNCLYLLSHVTSPIPCLFYGRTRPMEGEGLVENSRATVRTTTLARLQTSDLCSVFSASPGQHLKAVSSRERLPVTPVLGNLQYRQQSGDPAPYWLWHFLSALPGSPPTPYFQGCSVVQLTCDTFTRLPFLVTHPSPCSVWDFALSPHFTQEDIQG